MEIKKGITSQRVFFSVSGRNPASAAETQVGGRNPTQRPKPSIPMEGGFLTGRNPAQVCKHTSQMGDSFVLKLLFKKTFIESLCAFDGEMRIF